MVVLKKVYEQNCRKEMSRKKLRMTVSDNLQEFTRILQKWRVGRGPSGRSEKKLHFSRIHTPFRLRLKFEVIRMRTEQMRSV